MRGVSKVSGKKLWEASYVDKNGIGRLRKCFPSEKEANKQRIEWEKHYGNTKAGVKKGSILKDYRGELIGNFFIIDYLPNTNKRVLVRNTLTGKIETMDLHGIVHGESTGIPLVLKSMKFYSKKKEYGVGFRKDTQKWRAHITVNNKQITLGSFNTKEEAIAARLEAEEKYFKPILEKYSKEDTDV